MSVRISESRTPAGFLPSDLGQSAVSPTSNNVVLVSYQSSPIASRRIQRFVLFVTDNVMAAGVGSYEWTFTNGGNTVMTTSIGVAEFTPQNSGVLAVSVVVKNNANASLHTVSMNLQVISLNEGLELKIEQQENNFPGAAHPETSREMINDIRPYVNQLLPVAGNDALNKAICSLIYTRTLQTDAIRRQVRCEELAGLLHTQPNNFFSIAKEGFGLAKTRPQLLAMFLNHPVNAGTKYLNIATLELVASATTQQRNDNTSAIDTAFNALSVQEKIDLFNLLRFPKSHIQCIKTILEGLESRYYSAATLPATLSVVNDAKRLLTEYENGPVAFAAGANPLTASSFSQSVVNLFNHSVWTIPVTPLSGAANNAAAAVPAVAAAVGIPEKVPSHTFVAHHETEAGFGGGSLGFLRKAFLYHDSYALNPQEVRSFEELVDTLSSSNTPINRLRIVSHFGAPSGTNDLNGVGTMFLPFFTGQTLNNANTPHFQTFSEHFKYAISDDEGIKAQFEKNVFPSLVPDFLSSLTMNTATDTTMRTYYQAIFKKLQTNHDASLVPFGLENSGNPSTAVLTIMKWAANLFVLNEPQLPVTMEASFPSAVAPRALPALVKTAMINFINGKLNGLATSAGATTLANIQALSNAFSAQTLNTLNANSFQTPGSFILSSVYLDNHNTLRTQLATVRNRLNNSFVDIRGCRIGQDRTFMQGLRSFFGNPGSEPVISGPEWFQQFGTIGTSTHTAESGMDGYFDHGISGTQITATDVQRDYSAWSGRVGINSQISFWTNLMNGSAYDVLSLNWKTQIPPIGMVSERLQAIATQNYSDVIASLKLIFHLPAATAPSASDCGTFQTNSFPSVATLSGIITAVSTLSNASPQNDLLTQRTALASLATTLSATLPAAPGTLTRDHLDACIEAIKNRLVTLSGIQPLITTIQSRLSNSKAGFRYMLDIGLPIIIQAASNEGTVRLLYYPDLQSNALKSFKRIQFENPLPAATVTAIDALNPVGTIQLDGHGTADPNDDTYNDTGTGLLFSGLAIDHQDTQTAVVPSEEFHEHIKTEP